MTNEEAGLDSKWENAHLWGPGFGDEAAAGMMKAPKKVNQWYQNEGAEGWMRDLRKAAIDDAMQDARAAAAAAGMDAKGIQQAADAAAQSVAIEVEATAIAWDLRGTKWAQVDFLKRVEYKVQLKLPNKRVRSITLTIDVDAPPRLNAVGSINMHGAGNNPADLFSHPEIPKL